MTPDDLDGGSPPYGWNLWSLIFIAGVSALLWAGLITLGFALAQVG